MENNNFARKLSLEWWNELPSNMKLKFWRAYNETTFSPSASPDDLTGREIEIIWRKEALDFQKSETEFVMK